MGKREEHRESFLPRCTSDRPGQCSIGPHKNAIRTNSACLWRALIEVVEMEGPEPGKDELLQRPAGGFELAAAGPRLPQHDGLGFNL